MSKVPPYSMPMSNLSEYKYETVEDIFNNYHTQNVGMSGMNKSIGYGVNYDVGRVQNKMIRQIITKRYVVNVDYSCKVGQAN